MNVVGIINVRSEKDFEKALGELDGAILDAMREGYSDEQVRTAVVAPVIEEYDRQRLCEVAECLRYLYGPDRLIYLRHQIVPPITEPLPDSF